MDRIVDHRSFYTSMISVVYVMILTGIVTPHISIETLEHHGLLWVSLLTLGFMTARSTASLLHVVFYQRYSARVAGGLGLALLFTSYYLYSVSPPLYYPLLQLLTGFSSGLYWPLMQSLLARGLSPNWRSRGFSIYFILGSISGFIGYQLGSIIYVVLGPENLYMVGYMGGYIYVILYVIMAPGERIASSMSRAGSAITRGFRETKPYIPLILIVGGAGGLLRDYLIAYTKLVTELSEPMLRHVWSIAGYIGLALSYIASHIQERSGCDREVLVAGLLMILSLIALPFTRNTYAVLTIIALSMTGTRILRPVLRGITTRRTREPEAAIAVVNSLSNIAAAMTPLLIALL